MVIAATVFPLLGTAGVSPHCQVILAWASDVDIGA
jgi:hypothetical protein